MIMTKTKKCRAYFDQNHGVTHENKKWGDICEQKSHLWTGWGDICEQKSHLWTGLGDICEQQWYFLQKVTFVNVTDATKITIFFRTWNLARDPGSKTQYNIRWAITSTQVHIDSICDCIKQLMFRLAMCVEYCTDKLPQLCPILYLLRIFCQA